MIINDAVLRNFGACDYERARFNAQYPDGFDVSGLWGTWDEAEAVWKAILATEWKRQVGWAIWYGMLPARIRGDLSGVTLSGADLSGANLTGVTLSGVDLSWATLSGVDLSWANLSEADLSGAILSEANLSRATLSGATLSGVTLSGADLSGATLSGVILPED